MGTATRKSYRRRYRSSPCRKIRLKKGCRKTKGCKWASGTKRRFCRRATYRRRR